MSENTPGADAPNSTGFSREYVEQLRAENADWRRKYQTERKTNQTLEVGTELTRRGIKAEAGWVERPDGLTVTQAVDAFVAKHPHLAPSETPPAPGVAPDVTKSIQTGQTPVPGTMPKPEGPGAGAGAATPAASASPEAVRTLNEIKNDPVERAKVSAHYRTLLRESSVLTPPEAGA